ncbi:MAG: glycosyltransferase [Phycisphaerales bacterium]
MRILMMTNTYLPHVGGVARSVSSFTEEFRRQGHDTLVVAPTFDGAHDDDDSGVVRVPAIQNFNGSDFSVRLPIAGYLASTLDEFEPEIVHAHHPFLLGDTALRVAAARDLPLVFTHHTMYERYTHYVPGDSEAMRRFVIRMATDYANLCDRIIAPSESVAVTLRERGVETPIVPIPTGIDPNRFAEGDGSEAREQYGVPKDAFVVGHVGRLAPEKNLEFLARAVGRFLKDRREAQFLVVGGGPSQSGIRETCDRLGVGDRLRMTGKLTGSDLSNAYHAMNVFAFASHSETQGMVLAEAMTAGVPVVAVDAPGAREVVRDGVNGRLLVEDDEREFAAALSEFADASVQDNEEFRAAALRTAQEFSLERCSLRVLDMYRDLVAADDYERDLEDSAWSQALRLIETEWNLWSRRAEAAVDSLSAAFDPDESSSPSDLR